MTKRPVAESATIAALKQRAKSLLKSVRSGDEQALVRIAPYFPNPSIIGLQEVHLVLARERGYSSWSQLKTNLTTTADPHSTREELANRFLSLVTVSYFAEVPADADRFNEAAAVLNLDPEIVDNNIYVAAAVGDADLVSQLLDERPRLLDLKGGPYNWPPLLYAAYARLPGRSSFSAGRALIERGADANAFFMDHGQYRFTAITGVFGEGEAGKLRQPEHPEYVQFARMLLMAGASANDSQALYNRMFEPDNSCLELLLSFGLSSKDTNNWLVRKDGGLVANDQTVFDYQLAWALEHDMTERVRLLVEHGANVNQSVKGRTAYQWALLNSNHNVAEYLIGKGATVANLEIEDTVIAHIKGGSIPVEDLLRLIGDTTSLDAVQRRHPSALHEAAGSNDIQTATRLLAIGFNANSMIGRTPLHEAAFHGHIEMAELLIANGADISTRDQHHQATPIGWAEYNDQSDMIRLLSDYL